jgi:hypothetical protein
MRVLGSQYDDTTDRQSFLDPDDFPDPIPSQEEYEEAVEVEEQAGTSFRPRVGMRHAAPTFRAVASADVWRQMRLLGLAPGPEPDYDHALRFWEPESPPEPTLVPTKPVRKRRPKILRTLRVDVQASMLYLEVSDDLQQGRDSVPLWDADRAVDGTLNTAARLRGAAVWLLYVRETRAWTDEERRTAQVVVTGMRGLGMLPPIEPLMGGW